MDLLPLLHECVVLSDALQRQFIHQINNILLLEEAVLKLFDRDGKGG